MGEDPREALRRLRLEGPVAKNKRAHPWQAQSLRYWRKHRHEAQLWCAQVCGVSLKTYQNWESASTQLPYHAARILAALFEIPLSQLWNHQPPPG